MAKKFNLAEYVKAEGVSDSDPARIVEIPLSKIIANSRNFYGVRDVEALADSIKLNGLLEPLIVYPYGSAAGLYRLISGHRRLAALQLNKAEAAPCRIVAKPASAAREDLMLISANGQRTKTGPEVAAEAQRMTDALLALKKEGVELPGRLRDIVAEALGVSSTALARKKVINDGLKVPGFRQAWESGKMGETVAYELAQLPSEKQYEALDRLIDAGVNYETADIKTVQRIKRKVEAGESTKQDLAAEAEKRGIACPEGDYSPLLAALVREAIPSWERWDVLECPTKAAGVDLLHQFGLTRHSSSGGAIWFDSDPQALTLQRPICKRIKWPEVWELLALDAMQRQAVEAPAEDEKKPALVKLKDIAVKNAGPCCGPDGWRLCSRSTPDEGQLVTVMFDEGDGCEDWFAHVAVFKGGKYVEFGWESVVVDIIPGAVWAPLPGGWKEAAK
jgi:ParB family chromosome partitioning protein